VAEGAAPLVLADKVLQTPPENSVRFREKEMKALRRGTEIFYRVGLLLALATSIGAPAGARPDVADRPAEIAIGNPEDMAPVNDDLVIVSAMAGGERQAGALILADRRSGRISVLHPRVGAHLRASADCPAPVPAALFKPHGIALARDRAGARRLYVVNHGARESIEIFRFDMAPKPRLRWEGCVVFPPGSYGNAVAVAGDGTLFTTNLGRRLDGGPPLTRPGGEVLSWRPQSGWSSVPGSLMEGINGLLLSPDETTLYVAAWSLGEVVAVPIAPEGTAGRLALPFMPDNLRWSGSGTLFAAGHQASTGEVYDCYRSSRPICAIPSAIAEIDPAGLRIICVREVAARLATSVVTMGPELWIGSARDTRIERIKGRVCGSER
jgi:sugar lactone lactonase YvrE